MFKAFQKIIEAVAPKQDAKSKASPKATCFSLPVYFPGDKQPKPKKEAGDYAEPLALHEGLAAMQQMVFQGPVYPVVRQADSGSAMVAQQRESFERASNKLMESDATLPDSFKVMLIEEGMGNFGSCFYYTADAIISCVGLFEGKKCFANHPSKSEEQDRPERSVQDILGHFENVMASREDGRMRLFASLKCVPDETTRWARARLVQAIEYQKKFPDKYLVGLSINADGAAEPIQIKELLSSGKVPAAALQKLQDALKMGIDEVNLVSTITSANSCDLVTDPGAGGKVLSVE